MTCSRHPGVQATRLCLRCGNWFCDACMASFGSVPSCRSCAARSFWESGGHHPPVDLRWLFASKTAAARFARTIILVGSLVLLTVSALAALTFGYYWILFPTAGIMLLALVLSIVLARGTRRAPPFSLAQIKTLLRLYPSGITIRKLSDASGADQKTAREYLNSLVVSQHLEMNTEEDEVRYVATPSLEQS